ncbi:hypothetical protein BC827DRAFT_1154151 [Russula dissimulans]|nr:hypothetical protein BC827DRAFT_1154151 [Russula dissimulans]
MHSRTHVIGVTKKNGVEPGEDRRGGGSFPSLGYLRHLVKARDHLRVRAARRGVSTSAQRVYHACNRITMHGRGKKKKRAPRGFGFGEWGVGSGVGGGASRDWLFGTIVFMFIVFVFKFKNSTFRVIRGACRFLAALRFYFVTAWFIGMHGVAWRETPASMEGACTMWGVFGNSNGDDTSLLLRITNLAKRGGPNGQVTMSRWKAVRDRNSGPSMRLRRRCHCQRRGGERWDRAVLGTAIYNVWHWHDCADEFRRKHGFSKLGPGDITGCEAERDDEKERAGRSVSRCQPVMMRVMVIEREKVKGRTKDTRECYLGRRGSRSAV